MTDDPKLKVTKTRESDTGLIVLPTETKVLEVHDAPFRPTPKQRKIKTLLYAKIKHLELQPKDITVDLVYKYIGLDVIYDWWKVPEFKEWLRDTDEYSNKINYLLALQLDNLEEVIVDHQAVYDMRYKLLAGKQLMEFKKAMDEAAAKDKDMSEEDIRQVAQRIFESRLKSKEANDKLLPKKTKVDLPV